jgi:hypothetical protein
MIEAVFSGCVPLVPNRLSYMEMYDDRFIYNSDAYQKSLKLKLSNLMRTLEDKKPNQCLQKALDQNIEKLKLRGEMAIPNIFDEIKRLG